MIKNIRILLVLFTLLLLFTYKSTAEEHSHSGHSHNAHSSLPDLYAPIGVMGEHTHPKGGVMFSYRMMLMSMSGNRNGTDDPSTQDVLDDYMVAPTDMDMWMHMFGLMYAPTDNLTLTGMIPYASKSMSHTTRMGTEFSTKSDGIADIKVSALYKIFERNGHQMHITAGLNLPTGSTDEKDDIPAGANRPLPYPMQLGSGTFDLLPGITYQAHHEHWSWGAQVSGVIRLGENDEDYTLGDVLNTTAWGARKLNDWLSTAARLNWTKWGNIDGADPRLDPAVVPTADPNKRAGNRLDALLSLNFLIPQGPQLIKGQRFAVEFGFPLYQWLDGPQLETDWLVTFGWQYEWSL